MSTRTQAARSPSPACNCAVPFPLPCSGASHFARTCPALPCPPPPPPPPQESLGGNAKTTLLIQVAAVQEHVDETLQTLQFASRAMNVKNKPVVGAPPPGGAHGAAVPVPHPAVRGVGCTLDRCRVPTPPASCAGRMNSKQQAAAAAQGPMDGRRSQPQALHQRPHGCHLTPAPPSTTPATSPACAAMRARHPGARCAHAPLDGRTLQTAAGERAVGLQAAARRAPVPRGRGGGQGAAAGGGHGAAGGGEGAGAAGGLASAAWRVHTHTHAHTHAYTHTHTCAHTHTHMCPHTQAHTHTRTHSRIRTHTCTHIHTHTRAHAHTRTQAALAGEQSKFSAILEALKSEGELAAAAKEKELMGVREMASSEQAHRAALEQKVKQMEVRAAPGCLPRLLVSVSCLRLKSTCLLVSCSALAQRTHSTRQLSQLSQHGGQVFSRHAGQWMKGRDTARPGMHSLCAAAAPHTLLSCASSSGCL